MFELFLKKIEEIKRANNTVINPKKNLILTIIVAFCFSAVFGALFYFTQDWKYLFITITLPISLTIYSLYAFFKEKRHDKSSEQDKQAFLSGSKYRQKEWKAEYYKYKENHSFETISKKGMKHDLKKRYHKKDLGFIRIGFLLLIGSVLILFIPMTESKDKVAAIFGILCGGVISWIGLHDYIAGPLQKFLKQQTDLTEIEESYKKGKMLSFGNNGINIGSSYTVIYTSERVYAIDNNTIQDMTRKMVRVKIYEDNLYSDHEYRYYVRVIYTAQDGNTKAINVRLDEFQCEMMIAEFNRNYYPDRFRENTVFETTENSIVV